MGCPFFKILNYERYFLSVKSFPGKLISTKTGKPLTSRIQERHTFLCQSDFDCNPANGGLVKIVLKLVGPWLWYSPTDRHAVPIWLCLKVYNAWLDIGTYREEEKCTRDDSAVFENSDRLFVTPLASCWAVFRIQSSGEIWINGIFMAVINLSPRNLSS